MERSAFVAKKIQPRNKACSIFTNKEKNTLKLSIFTARNPILEKIRLFYAEINKNISEKQLTFT